ncbi:MAG: cytochrome c1 [Alphaproteobacteria bacterium]|nr:cytochrome c1 [Alphaproteobacteria bacterium]
MTIFKFTAAAAVTALLAFTAAASEAPVPPAQSWSFSGPFGTYDRAALQRGFQVYKEVCAGCHSLRHVYYRDLAALGYNEDEIKAIAASVEVQDGPNDQGEMFTRPGRPYDRFKSPFPNDNAARAANNGALPPDLSVITKARPHGHDYLYALMTGYKEPPADMKMTEGMQYNTAYAGNQIAMVPPLSEGSIEYKDGTKATVPQMARDVTVFLAWTAEPEMEERKRLGYKVLLFLLVLTGVLYAAMRRVWSKVH